MSSQTARQTHAADLRADRVETLRVSYAARRPSPADLQRASLARARVALAERQPRGIFAVAANFFGSK